MEKKNLRFEAIVDSNIEKINPLFSKVKIKIAYTGTNRNNSYISKEVFEKALPSIYNCPIIGEFMEVVDDFGSHGGKIEISDSGVKYIQTTKPYGVINENSEITWEDVVEDDGVINTYLCATGYIWTGRYDELFSVIENSKSQSMEISVNSGSFQKIDKKDVYVIDDFTFSGFCILGDSVEPCFEGSEITSYSFNKEEFKLEFSEMLKELKESVNQSSNIDVDIKYSAKEGGSQVDEKLELITKYNLTTEQLGFSIEDLSLEELEVKINEHFSQLASQKREEIVGAVKNEKYVDRWGDENYRYVYVDHTDTEVFVYDRQENWNLYGLTYGMNGDAVVVDFASKKRKKFEIVDFEEGATEFELFPKEAIEYEVSLKEKELKEQFDSEKETAVNEVQVKLDTVTEDFEKIKSKVEELKEFKKETLEIQRKESEDALFEQFGEKLKGIEEFETLKTKSSEFTLEELEDKCFIILGKQNANFSQKQTTKKDKVKMEFSKKNDEADKELDKTEEFLKKYLKKD